MDKSKQLNQLSAQQQQSRVKLSITTIYPIQLPKIKFYTQRTIHQEVIPSKKNQKPIPINFLRYLKNKQKKVTTSSLSQYKEAVSKKKQLHQSMYITNSLEKQENKLKIDQYRNKTLSNYDSLNFNTLLERITKRSSPQKEQKSKLVFNYYKKKFLKYRCRKSIDLEQGKMEELKKSLNNVRFLADGLKIQKMEIGASSKLSKQIINKAKFNTIIGNQARKAKKRQQIGPWNFKTEADLFDH